MSCTESIHTLGHLGCSKSHENPEFLHSWTAHSQLNASSAWRLLGKLQQTRSRVREHDDRHNVNYLSWVLPEISLSRDEQSKTDLNLFNHVEGSIRLMQPSANRHLRHTSQFVLLMWESFPFQPVFPFQLIVHSILIVEPPKSQIMLLHGRHPQQSWLTVRNEE